MRTSFLSWKRAVGNYWIMEKKIRKNDSILIGVLVLVAVLLFAGIRFWQGKATAEAVAVVTVDGEVYGRYPLSIDTVERLELPDGTYNVLEIRDGRADITEASCPDGICVKHLPICRRGESIVCLPNRVVVEVENGTAADIDFMVH